MRSRTTINQHSSTFMCLETKCFVLKDGDDRRGKFEAKAHEAVFVGYSRGSYMVYIIG